MYNDCLGTRSKASSFTKEYGTNFKGVGIVRYIVAYWLGCCYKNQELLLSNLSVILFIRWLVDTWHLSRVQFKIVTPERYIIFVSVSWTRMI